MNPLGIEQATDRLQKAEAAIERLKGAANHKEAETAWTEFLWAASAVYSKLFEGAKTHGKSEAWFGRKKKERKDDQLLRYLHQARNSDEHGIDPVVMRRDGENARLGYGKEEHFVLTKMDKATGLPTDVVTDGMQTGPTIWLTQVRDSRTRETFDPPKEHLGKRVSYSGMRPVEIAELGLAYLRSMVAEAETFVSSDSKNIAK